MKSGIQASRAANTSIISNSVLLPVRDFARVALSDARGGDPVPGSPEDHLEAALEWLARAQDISGDGGVSYGYSLRGGWLPPYRETSGYIAPTFYRAAEQLGLPEFAERADRIVRWLLQVQNSDGGFANPKYGPDGIVFDTGQCLFGLVAAYEHTGERAFLDAARKAGQWLVNALGTDPMWRRYEHKSTPHAYNTRTAWALVRLHQVDPQPQWEATARRNLNWALTNQRATGFFDNNAFITGDAPYTHNISYSICGLQESGWLLGDDRYIEAARRCSDATLALQRADGFIPGQIHPDGTPRDSYSCLTGQAQLSIVWAEQYERTGADRYRKAAHKSLGFVRTHHRLNDSNPAIRGAIAGSYPVWGRYAPLSYPNWAVKFFVDALLKERQW